MGVTSPRGREQSYSEDSQTELPRRSKCESPWLVSLQQQAPSPGLPLHPGTSWSPGGRRDSLGLSRQPPGLESPPPGICARSVIDAVWLAAASAAMWEACVRGRERPPGPGRGPAKATATASRFRPQFGKSGGLRGANTAEAPAFPSSGAPCSGAPPETGHKQSWWGWGSVSPHLDEPGVHLKGHRLAGCQVSCHTPRSASAVTAPPRFSSSKDRNSVIFSRPVSLAPAGSPWRGTAGLIQPDVVCVYRLF